MSDKAAIRDYIEKNLLTGGALGGDDDPLFTGGAVDSLGVLSLIAFLEGRFKVSIDLKAHALRDFDTVNLIEGVVRRLRDGR